MFVLASILDHLEFLVAFGYLTPFLAMMFYIIYWPHQPSEPVDHHYDNQDELTQPRKNHHERHQIRNNLEHRKKHRRRS